MLREIILVGVATFVFACLPRAVAQQFVWHSHTTMTTVRTVVIDAHGGYWAATAGGAFRVNPTTEQFDVYRNIDALSTIAVNSVATDPVTGVVAFGGLNGELDFLTPTGTWRHSLDIKLNEQRRSVNRLLFSDSLLYIAADYGISTYDVRRFAFIATCKHLGPVPTERRALSLALWKGTIFVGTESGLAYTPSTTSNLADSAFWKAVPASQLPSQIVGALAAAKSYLYIGTAAGLRAWDGTNMQPISGPAGLSSSNIVAITAVADTIFAASSNAIYQITGLNSMAVSWTPSTKIGGLAYDPSSHTLLVGDSTIGLQLVHNGTTRVLAPNSPGGNICSSITIDPNDIVWAASALLNGSGSGIYRFDGTTWQTFSKSTQPPLASNDIQAVSADHLGNIWAGTYGQGLLKLRDSSGTVAQTWYNQTNSPLSAIPEDPSHTFILVANSTPGPGDVQWIVPVNNLSGGSVHPQLVAFDPHAQNGAGAFYQFECPSSDYHLNFDVIVDGYGTKWVAPTPSGRIDPKSPQGLLYYNESRTLGNTADDICGIIGPGSPGPNPTLNTKNVTTVALDNDGEIWVGSVAGINIISNPDAVLTNPANLRIRKPILSALNGDNANITCIVADPLNNKWIGTLTSGLFVVSPDGTQQLAHFDHTNSPILDDDIFALAISKKTGLAYIGTKFGMSTLRATGLIQSVGSELKVGPQPYFIPSTSPLYIYGVPQDAEVKIFSVSGVMVRKYAPGDLALLGGSGGWDGKDSRGEWVASGIYLITFAQADGTAQVKKFAVVRR